MISTRSIGRLALLLVGLAVCAALGPTTAAATELSDYRWERRPLLVFAPTDDDPRLAETLRRIESSRCDFVERDMVLAVVVRDGTSSFDGHAIDADEALRLASQFDIGEADFRVLLIGKDGSEKLRVGAVPDLPTVYAVIDGMPMRSREMSADPRGR
ncbi:DUF4174 domain-containing protein [Mycobacterium sp. MBM]|nr:DUF4174 domain-containing protein [Mycobacterium sp. MBM]